MAGLENGQLSFSRPVRNIGIPVDVIERVGSHLTDKYNKNRAAATQARVGLKNMPDLDSDENKDILSRKSQEIQSTFSEYTESDKWHNADNAVYDMATKLQTDDELIQLNKDNQQMLAINKSIDESGASERYKALQKKINKDSYKGIYGGQGQGSFTGYTGDTLSGDLDISKYYKQVDDISKGWKADYNEYTKSGDNFNFDTATEGFGAFIKDIKKSTETVDPKKIHEYAVKYLNDNPNFIAETKDVARLELYERTGQTNPTKEIVGELLLDKAKSNDNIANYLLSSSEELRDKMEGMNIKQASAYLTKVKSNPELYNNYLESGYEGSIRNSVKINGMDADKTSQQFYYKMKHAEVVDNIANVNAEKYGYSETKYETKVFTDLLKDHIDKTSALTDSNVLFSEVGTLNIEDLKTNLTVYDDLKKDLLTQQLSLEGMPVGEERDMVEQSIKNIRNQINTATVGIENLKNELGITDQTLLDYTKDDIIKTIKDKISSKYIASTGMVSSIGKSAANEMYNILRNNIYNTKEDFKSAIDEYQYNTDNKIYNKLEDAEIDDIWKYAHVSRTENLYDIAVKQKKDVVSVPISAIGNLGTDIPTYNDNINRIKEDIFTGTAQAVVVSGSEMFKEIKGQNITLDLINEHIESVIRTATNKTPNYKLANIVKDNVKIEPVYISTDYEGSEISQLYRMVITDPKSGVSQNAIFKYTGDAIDMNDVESEAFTRSINSYNSESTNKNTNLKTAKALAGVHASKLKVTSVIMNGEDSSINDNLGAVIHKYSKFVENNNGDTYPQYIFQNGGYDYKLITNKEDGRYINTVYQIDGNGKNVKKMFTTYPSNSINTILEYIGAFSIADGADETTYKNIEKTFRVQKEKSKK